MLYLLIFLKFFPLVISFFSSLDIGNKFFVFWTDVIDLIAIFNIYILYMYIQNT